MALLARAGGYIHPREWLLKSAVVAPIERGFQSQRPPPPTVCAALDLAKELAQTIPELTYVSWDIALTSYPRYTQKAEAFHNNATISPS